MIAIPQAEIQCLAQTIHGEAQGESQYGQRAVAQVVINRTRSPKYPSTICGVVRQRHQFSGYRATCKPSPKAYTIATEMLETPKHLHSYLYFNTIGPRHSYRIGNHRFW